MLVQDLAAFLAKSVIFRENACAPMSHFHAWVEDKTLPMELFRIQLVLCPVHLKKGTALAPHNRIFLYFLDQVGDIRENMLSAQMDLRPIYWRSVEMVQCHSDRNM